MVSPSSQFPGILNLLSPDDDAAKERDGWNEKPLTVSEDTRDII